jgi:beta-phosphoglucomutase
MQMQRAVVWDLDGVVVDSAEVHNRSWTDMAAEFGVPYDPDRDFKRNFGKHNTDIISSTWNIFDPGEIARMADRKETLFRDGAHGLIPLPGVVDLIRALQQAGWKQGIGSSAPLENIRLLLEVTGLASYMQAIASGEDVTRGKPDPKVFLVAFERLGVDPHNGVVIEDAPAGVQAARAAGAAALAVTNTQTAEVLQAAGAHLVVPILEGITIPDLENLVRENQGSHVKRET